MRILKLILGMVKAKLISMFSFGKIKFILPIKLGKNVILSHRGNGKIDFGKHVSLNNNAHLYVVDGAMLKIGSFSSVGDNNIIVAREKISLGENVMLGANVCIYDHDHEFRKEGNFRDQGYNAAPVIIEDNVWLGAGVIVLKGVTIGTGSVIAAGTIVNKDIPPNSIVYNKREMIIKERV